MPRQLYIFLFIEIYIYIYFFLDLKFDQFTSLFRAASIYYILDRITKAWVHYCILTATNIPLIMTHVQLYNIYNIFDRLLRRTRTLCIYIYYFSRISSHHSVNIISTAVAASYIPCILRTMRTRKKKFVFKTVFISKRYFRH